MFFLISSLPVKGSQKIEGIVSSEKVHPGCKDFISPARYIPGYYEFTFGSNIVVRIHERSETNNLDLVQLTERINTGDRLRVSPQTVVSTRLEKLVRYEANISDVEIIQ